MRRDGGELDGMEKERERESRGEIEVVGLKKEMVADSALLQKYN